MNTKTIGILRYPKNSTAKARAYSIARKMERKEKYSLSVLEKYSYRQLQKMAKEMSMPSNVKKVQLIELIHTKVFGSQSEVASILHRIRLERLQKINERIRKKHLEHQRLAHSSPLSLVPNQNEENPSLQNNTDCVDQNKTYSYNERVLRKRSSRSAQLEVYGVMNINNTIIEVLKTEEKPQKKIKNAPLIKLYHDYVSQAANTANGPTVSAQKRRESHSGLVSEELPAIPAKRARRLSGIYPIRAQQPPAKNYVYEIVDGTLMVKDNNGMNIRVEKSVRNETKNGSKKLATNSAQNIGDVKNAVHASKNSVHQSQNYAHASQQTVDVKPISVNTSRNCTIKVDNTRKAQKPRKYSGPKAEKQATECDQGEQNVTEMKQNLPEPVETQTGQYTESMENCAKALLNLRRNSLAVTPCEPRSPIVTSMYSTTTNDSLTYTANTNNPFENQIVEEEDYYHKKIRAAQVKIRRESRMSAIEREELPRINEAFSNFATYSDSQPIYVQADEDRLYYQYMMSVAPPPPLALEGLYNFRMEPPATFVEAITRCVFSSPVCVTAQAQSSNGYGPYNDATYEQPNEYYPSQNLYNYFEMTEQNADMGREITGNQGMEASSSNASMELAIQVEDALELISQDGDYMERIGMDVRISCFLCSWEGPRIILETHIQKNHAQLIHKYQSLWTSRYTQSELCAGSSKVCSSSTGLVLLHAVAEQGVIKARLASLAPESMTIRYGSIITYNRRTGQPFTWEGEIPYFSSSLPFNEDDGLNVPIRDLDESADEGFQVVLIVKL